MTDDQKNTECSDGSAIYRLRWVADAMEAARRYAEAHPDEVQVPDPQMLDMDQG
jgi:hypothetical protein